MKTSYDPTKLNIRYRQTAIFLGVLLLVCLNSFSQGTTLLQDPFANGTTSGTSGVGNISWAADPPNDCDGNTGTFLVNSDGDFEISDVEGAGCCGCAGGNEDDPNCGDNNTTLEVGPIDGSGYYIEIAPDFIDISASGPMEPPSNVPCSNFTCGNTEPGCGDMAGPPGQNSFGQDQLVVSVNGIAIRSYCGTSEPCADPTLCFLDESIDILIIGGTQSSNESYTISEIEVIGYPYVLSDAQGCYTDDTGTEICETGSVTVCEGADVTLNTVAEIFAPDIPSSASFDWFFGGSNISSDGSTAEIMINSASSSDAGTYELYVVFNGPNNSATCDMGPFEIELIVEPEIDPGTNGSSSVENCASSTLDFNSIIGGDHPGGAWSDDDGAGVTINAGNSVSFDSVPIGDYDFTYSVDGCNPGSAVLTVTVEDCNPCDPDVDDDARLSRRKRRYRFQHWRLL